MGGKEGEDEAEEEGKEVGDSNCHGVRARLPSQLLGSRKRHPPRDDCRCPTAAGHRCYLPVMTTC